jgi:hypothetical protein
MLQIIFGKQKKANFLFFLKSRRKDYDISPQFRTQMGDGYDFFASVRDGVSIQHAFRLTNLVLVLILVVKSKAPYWHYLPLA